MINHCGYNSPTLAEHWLKGTTHGEQLFCGLTRPIDALQVFSPAPQGLPCPPLGKSREEVVEVVRDASVD